MAIVVIIIYPHTYGYKTIGKLVTKNNIKHMKIPQTYHNIILSSSNISESYIVNTPLDVNEMYDFTKKRLNKVIADKKIRFYDVITTEPGCPDVISLNTYANKLNVINGNNSNVLSIDKYL